MTQRKFSECGLLYLAKVPPSAPGYRLPPSNGGIVEAVRTRRCPCCRSALTQLFVNKLLCLSCGFSVECSCCDMPCVS